MCGIIAGARLRPGPSLLPSVRRMTSTLVHRGPDDSGYAQLDNGRVVLGHVRLSIVDLAAGPQPMSSHDYSVTISFNGEIYDHEKWRQELTAKGHTFRTHTDTEVILALYREYGLDFFQYLNGEFAFILWDAHKKRLIAARDRFGIKPLFFHRQQGQILFCSENKGLLALQEVERNLNPEYLTGALMLAYPSAISAFAGIEAMRPGHYLMVENETVHPQKAYWRPTFATDETMTLQQATEGVRHYLEQGVKRRMVADVPICAYLSGGIDSALVCGLAAQQGQTLKAFNIGFTNSIYDESAQARHIAEHFGVPFASISCPPEALAQALVPTLFHTEMALHNASSIGKYLLSKEVHRQGYKVALTGEGADEILAGYPHFKLEALWRMIQAGGPQAAQARILLARFEHLEARSEGTLWNKGDAWRTTEHPFNFPSVMYTRAGVYEKFMHQILHKDVVARGSTPQQVYVRDYNKDEINALHPLHASMVMTLNQLANYIFTNMGDRLEMANHVEGRTPFMDKDLVQFVSTIPPKYLIDIENLQEKYILHEAFDRILPEKTRGDHKHPFLAPSWRGMSKTKAGKALFDHYLSQDELTKRGITHVPGIQRIKRIWKLMPVGSITQRKLDNVMGTIMSLQIMHETFVAQRPASDADFAMTDMTPKTVG